MYKVLLTFVLATAAAFGQYKSAPAGAPPADLAPSIGKALEKAGTKIVSSSGDVACEIWLRTTAPSAPKSSEENVSLPTIPQGALLGVIRFPKQGSDRRGQQIKPGVYTLRYSNFPTNGDHQGVAPQRDFMVLSPASNDKDAAATPKFEALMDMSRKASGTPHPLVMSISNADDATPGLSKQGENDWVLLKKLGVVPLAIIVIGKVEG